MLICYVLVSTSSHVSSVLHVACVRVMCDAWCYNGCMYCSMCAYVVCVCSVVWCGVHVFVHVCVCSIVCIYVCVCSVGVC